MRLCISCIFVLGLAGCADSARFAGADRAVTAGDPVASATFCEVMAAQGGMVTWSTHDTRLTKERIDKLNEVWLRCPQYRARPAPPK